MSQHVILQNDKRFVFGWDPPLGSFFLQIHDLNKDEEENPIVWLGTAPEDKQLGVGVIVQTAREHGLIINREMQGLLYEEKRENRA